MFIYVNFKWFMCVYDTFDFMKSKKCYIYLTLTYKHQSNFMEFYGIAFKKNYNYKNY